jgi:hypothetical protein
MNSPEAYDGLSAVVLLLGIYQGVVPLVVRLVFDGNQLLACRCDFVLPGGG